MSNLFENEHLYVCFDCEDGKGYHFEFEHFEDIENPECPECGSCSTLPKYYLEDMNEEQLEELCIAMTKQNLLEGNGMFAGFEDDIKGLPLSEAAKDRILEAGRQMEEMNQHDLFYYEPTA